MKKKFLKALAFACVAATTLVFGGGCTNGAGNVDGAYKLAKPAEETEYHVVFELSNPTVTEEGGAVVSAKLRLTNVYFDVRYVDADKNKGAELTLDRSVKETGEPTNSYNATLVNKRNTYAGYVAPFDLGTPSHIFNVSTYKYYRLTAKTHDIYLDEVIFVGEILGEDGNGTGEKVIVPAKVFSAVRQDGESEATAKKNAQKLLDNQPSSAEAFQ